MTGCNGISRAEIERRKTHSDKINNTDSLTFAESKNGNTRADAYRCSRGVKDKLEIKYLEQQTDEEYFNELLKDGG